MDFVAPVDAIAFTLDEIADLKRDAERGACGDYTPELLGSILDEAGRFAREKLAPINQEGDKIGAQLNDGRVTLPTGWAEIYQEWIAAGWNGVDLPSEWGGMGLPTRIATAVMEIWTSANMSFAMGPVLTQGGVDALVLHASDELKQKYLSKLVSGEWAATMNLTEPQAGSDLGALRTRAVPQGDGTYRITGNKIFISWGEHEFTENIIHLVLARLPDAPAGTKGISLFVVPKFLVNEDGSLGARNDLICTGLEHKLGIHASPTCSMSFGEKGGAVGWLVGEENRGLNCMFTMMNKARLFTGLQGVAIGEIAYQAAQAYAQERKQGRAPGAASTLSSAIIEHPDVARNLATMRALNAATRAVSYVTAGAIDLAHASPDPTERKRADELAGLLTPICKAWCSEMGFDVTSIGVQVHGGMGYVEETGVAQYLRDARIPPIYEGTNGIQAIDLVMRKVLKPGSSVAHDMIAQFESLCARASENEAADVARAGKIGAQAVEALREATGWIFDNARNHERLLWSASPYLRLWGIVAANAYLVKGALAAADAVKAGDVRPVCKAALADARFFAENFGVLAAGQARIVMGT